MLKILLLVIISLPVGLTWVVSLLGAPLWVLMLPPAWVQYVLLGKVGFHPPFWRFFLAFGLTYGGTSLLTMIFAGGGGSGSEAKWSYMADGLIWFIAIAIISMYCISRYYFRAQFDWKQTAVVAVFSIIYFLLVTALGMGQGG